MESVAPPLVLLMAVKRSIEKGDSIRNGIKHYLVSNSDEFSIVVAKWYAHLERNLSCDFIYKEIKSHYRVVLLQLLERGLGKEPIYQNILILEQETIEACQREIQEKLTKLPYLLMIPVLLFQFPALVGLFVAPILQNMLESLNQ